MNDSIPPPQPITQGQLQTQQQPAAQAQQQQQLFKLPVGAQFNAAVVGGDKNGNAIIRFAGNDLVLSSPIALSKGAQLALKVDSASGTINLQLLTVDGKLPATQAQANSNQLQNPTPQQNQSPILKLLNIAPSNTPAAQAFTNQTAATTQNVSQTQQAVVLSSSKATNAVGVVVNPLADAVQGARTQIKAQLPQQIADKALQNIPAIIKSGTEINFKVSNIQQPQQAAPNIPNPTQLADSPEIATDNKTLKGQDFHQQQPQQNQQKSSFTPNIQVTSEGNIKVSAQVITQSNSGQIIVDTSLGKISLNTSLPADKIQPGTILNLEISSFNQPRPEANMQSQNPLQSLMTDWPALRELANVLNQAGQQNALNKLAGLDSIFAARLANYFNSVQKGNIGNWLSQELMDVLDEKTKEQVMAKLRGDFANFYRLANDSGSSWQTFLFPIFDGEALRQAKFHLKYLDDESGNPDKEEGARFMVEFNAGSFGDMQLDGLVRKNIRINNFDLIVRSHDDIAPEIQNDIREIFTNAQEVAGFNGSLEFSKMQDFPQNIMDEKLSRLMHSDGVLEV